MNAPLLKKRYLIKSIGIILLVVILSRIDLNEVVQRLRSSDPVDMVLAILLILPQVAIRAWRWKRLLALQSIRCAWPQVLTFYFAAIFAGLVTPGRLGELAKGVFLKQQGLATIGYSLPSVLADRMFDLLVLTLVALMALPHFGLVPHAGAITLLMLVLVAILTLAGLTWLFSSDRLGSLARRLRARLGDNWSGTLDDFVGAARSLCSVKLLAALVLTFMSYALYFAQTYLIGQAIGLPLDYAQIAMVVAVGILVGYIPITVAGLGTRDAVFIVLFARFGVPAASALSFAFLYNLVYIACVGAISAAFWMRLPDRQALRK